MAHELAVRTPTLRIESGADRLPLIMLGVGLSILVPTVVLVGVAEGVGVALIGPLMGPWAGLSIGHSDCTMAAQMPRLTWTLVGTGIALGLMVTQVRRGVARALAPVLFAVWMLGWCGMAMLSFINASS